jgi:hypothetical protein
VAPSPRTAAALLIGTGGAGAVTMLAVLLGDLLGGLQPEATIGALAFALLLSIPLALATTTLLRPGGGMTQVRGLLTFAILCWLGGLGSDLFNPTGATALATAGHAAALLGGVAAAIAGWMAYRPPLSRAARRRALQE